MQQSPRIAILISGTGTNMHAILNAIKDGELDAVPVFVGSDKAAGTVWKKTTFALLSLDEMKSGAVTVPSSGESCANFAAALNAGAALFNDTPAETLPGKPDVVLRKWTASESYPVLEK